VPSGHRETDDSLNASVARAENMQVSATGQLNPTWVEWLMGFPLTWTALLAYPSSPRRRIRKEKQPDASTDSKRSATPSSRKRASGSAGKSGGQ
jgi:hypothetical protein